MPLYDFRLTALIQQLDDKVYLGETLFFPEMSCVGRNVYGLQHLLEMGVKHALEDLNRRWLYQRTGRGEPRLRTLTLTLDPPERYPAWVKPLELSLPVIWWHHGDDACIAYLPALHIEVVAEEVSKLDALLIKHVKSALMRRKMMRFDRLVPLTRGDKHELKPITLPVKLKTPKQQAQDDEEERGKRDPIIEQVGMVLTKQHLAEAFEVEEHLPRLAEYLTGRTPRSVLLVGPSGVGKTALLHELIRRREAFQLGRTPFWATSGARLVAGMSGFGMWQQRCQQLCREAAKEKAILHLGNLMELMEVGKSEYHQQGIASFLRPYLARGEILAVAECTPEQVPLIERQEPHLLHIFANLSLEEPTRERGLAILTSQALALALRKPDEPLPIESDTLHTLDQLHRRYATYSAYPGRPLRFLKNLFADRPQNAPINKRDVTRAFSHETGLPLFLLDDNTRLDLNHARRWFAERVIGQPEAVDLLTDLLATVKARLTRPRKPIASLMFIGPTGVGKTEMAKALAEYLFGSRQRLTRYDMSEYSDPLAVQRLIGGIGCAEGVLTARVREQPFSVILLDEFEKADPQLFDLLLQVLGEGRLTDAQGRLADFSNSVVIMTSNLGSASYQQGTIGYAPRSSVMAEAREHFTREVQRFVRPEFFNRIDRIVPFGPLDESTILQIANRQLKLVELRDGIRYRGVQVEVSATVAAWLAKKGYDARYGARPLKRAIDREMLAPLADRMNEYSSDTPLRVKVELDGEKLDVEVRARTDESGRMLATAGAENDTVKQIQEAIDLRRDLQRLQRSTFVIELVNEIFRLERLHNRLQERKKIAHYEDLRGLEKLDQFRQMRNTIERLFQTVCRLEDEGLLRLYEQRPLSDDFKAQTDETRTDFEAILLQLFLRRYDKPDAVTVAVFSEQPERLWAQAHTYWAAARARGGRANVWQILPPKSGRDKNPLLLRRWVIGPPPLLCFGEHPVLVAREWDAERFTWKGTPVSVPRMEGVIGIALEITAPAAYPFFASEVGLHAFSGARNPGRVLVDVDEREMTGAKADTFYTPPAGVDRRGYINNQPKRRTYNLDQQEGTDLQLDSRFDWNSSNFDAVVYDLMEKRLVALARSAIHA